MLSLIRRLSMPLLLATAGLLVPALSLAQGPDGARVVEGQAFAGHVKLGNTELQLNGTGVRAVAWFKGYAVGLYLPQRATTAAQVFEQPGPKRLQLRMLQEVPATEFVKALQKGIERNSSAGEWAALQPRVQRFAEQITASGAVHKRDTVDLDESERMIRSGLIGEPSGNPSPCASIQIA